MKSSKRRFFTQTDKDLMWDRWQKGESLNSIARLLATSHSAISGVLSGVKQTLDLVHIAPQNAPHLSEPQRTLRSVWNEKARF